MATVKEIKATARPKAGKGAARSERRAGRVPGVIYGDNKPPQADLARIRRPAAEDLCRAVSDHGL